MSDGERERNLDGESDIRTGDAWVDADVQPTPLELTDSLLREQIDVSGKYLVVIFSFEDLPNQYLVYETSDDTRSLGILGEEEALARGEFYERLVADRQSATSRTEIVSGLQLGEFLPVAEAAIRETGTHPFNTQYLLDVLQSLREA